MKKKGYVPRMLDTEQIRSRREDLGLTMEAAAKLAGFKSRQHWNGIETGTAGGTAGVRLATLNAVAKALKCDAKELLK